MPIIAADLLTRADKLRGLLIVGVLVGETAVALSRARSDREAPFSGRFSWSMFAGPITARCHHALSATDALGRAIPVPLPSDRPELRALLLADTPARFAAVAPWFAPYADDDAAVSVALDDVLARYHRSLGRPFTLISHLRCDSPGSRPFTRTARWTTR